MNSESHHPPPLAGWEATAKILRTWLVDGRDTRSGVVGVDDALQVVSVRTFQHRLSQPTLNFGLDEAIRASATGILVYDVADEEQPGFDRVFTSRLEATCEALNVTLLDFMLYSRELPLAWLSARKQSIL